MRPYATSVWDHKDEITLDKEEAIRDRKTNSSVSWESVANFYVGVLTWNTTESPGRRARYGPTGSSHWRWSSPRTTPTSLPSANSLKVPHTHTHTHTHIHTYTHIHNNSLFAIQHLHSRTHAHTSEVLTLRLWNMVRHKSDAPYISVSPSNNNRIFPPKHLSIGNCLPEYPQRGGGMEARLASKKYKYWRSYWTKL
jgi:hypothetical protein